MVDDGDWWGVDLPGFDESYQREIVSRSGHALVTVVCIRDQWAIVDLGAKKQRIGGDYASYDEAIAAAEAHINTLD